MSYCRKFVPARTSNEERSNNVVDFTPNNLLKYPQTKSTLKIEYCSRLSGSMKGNHMSQTKQQNSSKKNPFKRGSTWTYIVYPRDPITGKCSKPKWVGGFATEAEAKAELLKAKAEITCGTYRHMSALTVAQYMRKWFNTHSKIIEPSTACGYSNNIHRHIIPHLGKVKLCDLDRHKLTAFYFMLQEKEEMSPASIRYVHATLRKALNDAVADDLLQKNPCEYANCPKGIKFKAKILDEEQSRKLLEGVLGTSIETEILLALSLGLRRGEALGIQFQNVDFVQSTVQIAQQVTTISRPNEPNRWGIKSLKTEGSNRPLVVPGFVLASIKARQAFVDKQKQIMGSAYEDDDLVCCNDDGTPKSPQTVYHQFKRLLKQLGLPDIRIHDLRHTCASLLLEKDVPLKVISQSLGHSTISITADTYVDIMERKKHQPADVMQQLFGKDKTE